MANYMAKGALTPEARAGLERAWLDILRARYPGLDWRIVRRATPPTS